MCPTTLGRRPLIVTDSPPQPGSASDWAYVTSETPRVGAILTRTPSAGLDTGLSAHYDLTADARGCELCFIPPCITVPRTITDKTQKSTDTAIAARSPSVGGRSHGSHQLPLHRLANRSPGSAFRINIPPRRPSFRGPQRYAKSYVKTPKWQHRRHACCGDCARRYYACALTIPRAILWRLRRDHPACGFSPRLAIWRRLPVIGLSARRRAGNRKGNALIADKNRLRRCQLRTHQLGHLRIASVHAVWRGSAPHGP